MFVLVFWLFPFVGGGDEDICSFGGKTECLDGHNASPGSDDSDGDVHKSIGRVLNSHC